MKRNIDLASLSIGVYNRVLFKNSTELKMRQMTRVGPFQKGEPRSDWWPLSFTLITRS